MASPNQSRRSRVIEGMAIWGSYYRENIDIFVEEYLQLDFLKWFQTALLVMMDRSRTFLWIAARGMGKSFLMVNRFIQSQSYGKNFKVTFLDCSPFNRKELGDMYLKACQFGLPFISMYAASQGMSQSEVDCMSFLENEVLGLASMFKPLQSSSTLSGSSDSNAATDEGGAPQKDTGDLTDSGEQTREDGDDW